jgi:hypothetical protein
MAKRWRACGCSRIWHVLSFDQCTVSQRRAGQGPRSSWSRDVSTWLTQQKDVPDLSKTSISIIINPVLGLPILKSLFPVQSATSSSARNGADAADSQNGPHAVWFQPGAADEHIKSYVRENGLEGRVVLEGCVLVSGDQAREAAGQSAGKGRL